MVIAPPSIHQSSKIGRGISYSVEPIGSEKHDPIIPNFQISWVMIRQFESSPIVGYLGWVLKKYWKISWLFDVNGKYH